MYVTRFRSAELIPIHVDGTPEPVQSLPNIPQFRTRVVERTAAAPQLELEAELIQPDFAANVAWRARVVGNEIAVLHQRAQLGEIAVCSGGYGGGGCETAVGAGVSKVGPDAAVLTGGPLSLVRVGVDLAVSPDGKWWALVDRPAAYVDVSSIGSYPPPVQRYLKRVLSDGSRIPQAVVLTQSGTMNTGEGEQWAPFASDQYVVLHKPGFDWNASVRMLPGVGVRVHDAYVQGTGYLEASLLGLVQVAYLRGNSGDIAEGELMRFLAESAWYPQVLLPGNGVEWEPLDDRSARATLSDGNVTAKLTFLFDEADLIGEVRGYPGPPGRGGGLGVTHRREALLARSRRLTRGRVPSGRPVAPR